MPSPDTLRGRHYLERAGIIPTYRNPGPRIEPRSHAIHTEPDAIVAPLPLPTLQGYLNGDPAPDRGQTLEWPHPLGNVDDE